MIKIDTRDLGIHIKHLGKLITVDFIKVHSDIEVEVVKQHETYYQKLVTSIHQRFYVAGKKEPLSISEIYAMVNIPVIKKIRQDLKELTQG